MSVAVQTPTIHNTQPDSSKFSTLSRTLSSLADNINYVGSDSVEVSVQLHPNAQTASNTYGNSRPSKPDRMAYSTYAIPRPLNSILPNPNDSAASSSGPPAGKDTYVMLHSGGSTDPALNGIQPSYQDCAVSICMYKTS